MTYREQEVRELPVRALELRCYCEAPAEVNCASCRRPRCAAHVAAGLCSRCTVVIERAMAKDSGRRWTLGGGAGVVVTLGALIVKLFPLALAGLPIALVTAEALRRARRRHLIETLRAPLALSTGDVTASAEYEEPFPSAPAPPHGTGIP